MMLQLQLTVAVIGVVTCCMYLETWHFDIEDFIDLRRNTGDERRRTHDMNTANWIPDLFMKRVVMMKIGRYFLRMKFLIYIIYMVMHLKSVMKNMNVRQSVVKLKCHVKLPAKQLWRKMLSRLFETGHPWITFKDPCNVRSPQDHAGVVHSSNLCTEITFNTSAEETAVCNLGSVNLSCHVVEGNVDDAMLAETVAIAIRMLDNVIDINFYPTKEARNCQYTPSSCWSWALWVYKMRCLNLISHLMHRKH